MKIKIYTILVACLMLFLSCKNVQSNENNAEVSKDSLIAVNVIQKENITFKEYSIWILEFRRLRQALYKKDTTTLKTFFDFPLTERQTEGISNAIQSYPAVVGKIIKISTEQDFEKDFKYIFPIYFVNGLLPIKSDSLQLNAHHSSKKFKLNNNDVDYSIFVSFDEQEQILSLYLNSESYIKEEGFMAEGATILQFKLNKNGKLKFDSVFMAG